MKSLTVLGHAGEGTFLSEKEQMKVIEAFVESVNDEIPIIAGITEKAQTSRRQNVATRWKAGAKPVYCTLHTAGCDLVIKKARHEDKYRACYEDSDIPLILFQYPDATKCTYDLETQLEISAQPGRFCDEKRCP